MLAKWRTVNRVHFYKKGFKKEETDEELSAEASYSFCHGFEFV